MPELVNPIQEVLDEAGLKADDISKVILFFIDIFIFTQDKNGYQW